jgi:hypothetical protein
LDDNKADGGEPRLEGQSHWRRIERVFAIVGGLASLAAVAALVVAGIERLPVVRRHNEEAMVGELVPGLD